MEWITYFTWEDVIGWSFLTVGIPIASLLVAAAILRFVWYPFKRLVRARRGEKIGAEDKVETPGRDEEVEESERSIGFNRWVRKHFAAAFVYVFKYLVSMIKREEIGTEDGVEIPDKDEEVEEPKRSADKRSAGFKGWVRSHLFWIFFGILWVLIIILSVLYETS